MLYELNATFAQARGIGEPKGITLAFAQISSEVKSLHDRYFNSPHGTPLKCALTPTGLPSLLYLSQLPRNP